MTLTSAARVPLHLAALLLVTIAGGVGARAQGLPETSAPGAAKAEDALQTDQVEPTWRVRIGGGLLYAPLFLGSKQYQLLAWPNVSIRYRDRVFLSVVDGLGVDLIKFDGFRAGPVIRYEPQRYEDNKEPFRITGQYSNALRGLGNVGATAEAGGFAEYEWHGFNAKLGLRQGIGGHRGLVGDIDGAYTTHLSNLPLINKPAVFSIGPRLTLVDAKYNQSYFGVTAQQSMRSGLPEYTPKGGLLSFGVGSEMIIPMTRHINVSFFSGYDRLAGDAGNSPLVTQRGSKNQFTSGIGVSYSFGR